MTAAFFIPSTVPQFRDCSAVLQERRDLDLVGASTLHLDDMSKLGPLDIPLKKDDEIVGRNSGMDIIQAVPLSAEPGIARLLSVGPQADEKRRTFQKDRVRNIVEAHHAVI
jgi:hypothetical protein